MAAGLGDTLGNKGGVCISFNVGESSFAFIGSHFQADQNAIKERNEDFHRITDVLPKLLDNKV